jgi:hypothetical protein
VIFLPKACKPVSKQFYTHTASTEEINDCSPLGHTLGYQTAHKYAADAILVGGKEHRSFDEAEADQRLVWALVGACQDRATQFIPLSTNGEGVATLDVGVHDRMLLLPFLDVAAQRPHKDNDYHQDGWCPKPDGMLDDRPYEVESGAKPDFTRGQLISLSPAIAEPAQFGLDRSAPSAEKINLNCAMRLAIPQRHD